jgi:hypothetical protein
LFSYLCRKPACLVAFLRLNRFACVACFNLVEPNSEVNGHHGHQANRRPKVCCRQTPTRSSCPCPVKSIVAEAIQISTDAGTLLRISRGNDRWLLSRSLKPLENRSGLYVAVRSHTGQR